MGVGNKQTLLEGNRPTSVGWSLYYPAVFTYMTVLPLLVVKVFVTSLIRTRHYSDHVM